MTWGQLLAFNVALLVAIASPGAALVMAAHTSVRRGRAAGVAAGAGLGLMAATWTMLALRGLGTLFELFPTAYIGAKVLGGAYLLYLAHKMWRNTSEAIDAPIPHAGRALWQGFLVNLLNPKSVFFASAVLVSVFPGGISIADSLVIVINHFLVEFAFYTTLAFCASTRTISKHYIQARSYVDRGGAVILATLGLRFVFGREETP